MGLKHEETKDENTAGADRASGVDRRGKLDENPFEWQVTKDGRVMVSWQGKLIKTLAGRAAEKVLAAIDAGDEGEIQLALAKATGNFKRGNERHGKG